MQDLYPNQRYEAIFNENNGFFDKTKMKGDFLGRFQMTYVFLG